MQNPKLSPPVDESFLFMGILQLYNRFLGFVVGVGLLGQIFVYGWQYRWHWPLTLCSYEMYSLLNGLVWGIFFLCFYFLPSFFTLPVWLKRFLPYLKYKQNSEGTKQIRSTQQVFLIIYFILTLIRFSLLFWAALFSLMVLFIGALGLQLYLNPLYWLNGLPILDFFYILITQKPSSDQFQRWLAISIKPSLTRIKETAP